MNLEDNIPCPECGKQFKQRIDQMNAGTSRRCPWCGVEIRFTGTDGRDAQRAIDNFTKSIKDINLKIKF